LPLKSELNYSEKQRHKNASFIDDALKTRGIKYLNTETWLLFAPPYQISGYAPAATCSMMSKYFFKEITITGSL